MNRENMQREFKVTAGEQKRILFMIQKKKEKRKEKERKERKMEERNELTRRPSGLISSEF